MVRAKAAEKAKEAKAVIDAASAKRKMAWTGFGPDKLERVGGRLGGQTTQLNISQQQLALMIKAQADRVLIQQNLSALKQSIISGT